jgi:hypothetical protein
MPRVTEMYAFVMSDTEPDDEGIPAIPLGPLMMPMTGADMNRVASLMPHAQKIANRSGKQLRIMRFTGIEKIGEINPE